MVSDQSCVFPSVNIKLVSPLCLCLKWNAQCVKNLPDLEVNVRNSSVSVVVFGHCSGGEAKLLAAS